MFLVLLFRSGAGYDAH